MSTMQVVAVAGGTGKLGRTIVEAILQSSKYEVIILSRKPDPQLGKDIGAPIVPTDYYDTKAITKILEDKNVHTLVSAITMGSPADGRPPPEIQLIQAADASKLNIFSHIDKLDSVIHKLDAQKELARVTDLETTYFLIGTFMDYWGPAEKTRLAPFPVVLDIPNNMAAISGSGDTPVVFTHTIDVAKFVAASLALTDWDPVTYIMGDKLSWNQVVKLAEAARGREFKVSYDSLHDLKNGKRTELPGQANVYNYVPKEAFDVLACALGTWYEEGFFNFDSGKTLNTRLPHIETLKMKDILNEAWGTAGKV
ncbi:nmrA-like family protein [Beauveria bassiana ARSEF 2860]|uniref:NmrA-like family protein n=1 Tax=Beauveria bassiana (strain ARSEF 2860) TaxID=655819 RepID=J5JKP8_BEAB2|nr:nmrA-like family protein [Beauveria bassiana ARSEF 2860]EJP63771.1 nmrA-like family protein [Beauveria bassiana ARSEF 2860]